MPHIFSSQPGVAAVVSSEGAVPSVLNLGPTWRGFEVFKCVVTGMALQGQGGVQFMSTMRDYIYIHTFSERMQVLSISGLAFGNTCGADGSKYSGLDGLLYYYTANRLTTTGKPVRLTVGVNTALSGFLAGFNFQITDPSTVIGQFTLDFRCPPVLPVIKADGTPVVTPAVPQLAP